MPGFVDGAVCRLRQCRRRGGSDGSGGRRGGGCLAGPVRVELGTYAVLAENPADGAKKLHFVYTERKNLEAYLKTGSFPDGAVLVKDVFAGKTGTFTTGTVSYADDLLGRFVLFRDSSNAKAGSSPRFGDGWGWAYYQGSETKMTVTTNYKTDCLGCHEPARATDLVYVQG